MLRIVFSAALVAACSGSATRTPVRAPVAAALSVESCNTLGETSGGRTCSLYDTQSKSFVDDAAADPLQRRAMLYDRWMDLYNSADRQEAIRNMKDAMAPGDPESKWGDENEINYWDDAGDSAGFGDTLMNSVLFRYIVTGTDADYQRFEGWLRGQVQKFEATGMDGYLARWFYALVPPGTQIRNGLAMDTGGDKFVTPAAALPRMPAWFSGQDARWSGHTSIDAYSGPMNSWPLAFPLVRDAGLRQRMARHYGCFLKRLRIFKIVNLSKNAQLQSDVARYLTSTVLSLDPDDPDLTKVDQVWGFYLPQFNDVSASSYPSACPDHLATDATAADTIDVTVPGFDGKLLDFILRQAGGDQANSIDFAYYPSVRAGDAVMLIAYALGAYELTGDPEFLTWRDQVLIGKANAREVGRTIGAFQLPRPCRSYYRTPNVYTAHFMRTLLDGDSSSRDFADLLWTKKFAAKEVAGLRDALFEILYSGAIGARSAGLEQALSDLAGLGGAPGHLDDPRRNYAVDLSVNTPADVRIETASQAELDICSTPVSVLGITIPVDKPDPNVKYANPAPPVMERPPDNWIWEKDPFGAVRTPGDAGHQQYTALDYTEPYWMARYFGFLPDTHLVLAWK
ncbi:MAG: hypothetical protein ACXWLM_11365 [Myxococcales bacterium]